jgi:hypothetical protein
VSGSAFAVLIAVSAACRGGAPAGPSGGGTEGRDIVIHAARDGSAGHGHIDERRWIDVPARGELLLGPVSPRLELDSVVTEALDDPRALAAQGCHVLGAAAGLRDAAWLWNRPATVTLSGGDTVEGEIVDVGEPVAIIDDGDVRTAVAPDTVHHDDEVSPPPTGDPVPGQAVYAVDDEGNEVFGTLAALQPSRLVLRTTSGARRSVDVDAIVRLALDGLPASPMLRCTVASPRPGRHLVRLAYAAPDLSWRAGYRVTLGDPAATATADHAASAGHAATAAATVGQAALDRVTLQRSFELRADGLPPGTTARVRLVLGLPAEAEPPVTVWQGEATLGGGAVEVRADPVERRARIDRVYRGALARPGENPRFPEWRDDASATVWRELAFERLPADAPGRVRVGLHDAAGAVRWVDGELTSFSVVRVPLLPDPDLVGFRRKLSSDPDGSFVLDDIALSVANRGTAPALVAIEEELRPIARPDVLFARFADRDVRDALLADRWRTLVTVPPGEIVQGQLVLRYVYRRP